MFFARYKKCANGNFSFSLVSCSSITIFQSAKNASHPDKRWLSAYLPAHTCTALPPQVALHAIVVSADETDSDWISTCAALCGCAERSPCSRAAVREAPASRWKRKSDERRVSLPVSSFLSIVSVKKRRNALLASPSQISKVSVGCRVGVEGGRKEGSAQEVWKNGQLATHTDAHEYTVTEHSQLSAFYIPAYRFIDTIQL